MATSQQGKKKKKVLSQQQIDKLLGMLREEDKPLRAGILAKTLGYQSAKDINPTLLRLEGYGMVSRVTMNNTPLWKYVGREGIAVMTSSSRDGDDVIKDSMDGVRILAGPRLQHENGTMHPVLEARDDSCPSRPQSTKADLEWDPTDIQAHHDDDMLHGASDVGAGSDFPQMSVYGDNGQTTNFVNSQHGMPMHTKDLMGTPNGRLTTSTASLNGARLNGASLNGVDMTDVSGLNFTNNQGYVAQDLYGTMESRTDQMGVHGMNMNGLDTKLSNGQNFVGQDYSGMSGYNEAGDISMNGGHGTNMNSTLQSNYDYAQQNSQNENGRGGANDMYMLSNNNLRHMTNGISNNSMPSNLQNFPLPPNQVHSDYSLSNNYTSSISSTGPKSSTSSNQNMQNYSRENHNHSHYNQNSYNSSSSNMGRNSQVMPTYVVQEIIKPESVSQFGMAGPQGPPETRTMSGYQSMHPHPHGLDPGVMSYSQQPYHTAGGLSNGGPSAQHQHHQQQQPQQQIPAQQHRQPHHQHHQQHQQHHQQHHHQQHHHHQHHQQPLTQAANYVNVGTFTNGTYNQFQGTFGLGTSGHAFSGQHPQGAGYGSGSITSKDLANFSGTGAAYRGGQMKRQQHFNGYTNTGLFTNQVRPPVFGKMGQARQPFPKHGFNRNHMEKPRGPHNRSKGNTTPGRGPKLNNGHFDETKAKLGGGNGCGEKDQSKVEVNKYMGTEVLDDICRRLNKQVSVQKKSPEQTPQKEDIAKRKEEPGKSAKSEKQEEKSQDLKKDKSSVVDNSTEKASNGSKESNSTGTNGEKLTNGKEQPAPGARPQNNHRGYGAGGKYQQYPYRGGYHSRETSRHHHHRNSSRNSIGKAKGSENAGNVKPANQTPPNKVISGSTANGKAEDTKTTVKDASQGSEPSKLAEVKSNDVGGSNEQVQDDRPMAKYRSLLTDHLDPNNVLLSHLFVRGLIDRVLVDQVRRMKTRRDAMDCLLPALLGIPEDAICAAFCDALQKSGQVYLAELIKATGINGEAMTDKHASFLKLHHQNIAASMIPDKELLAYLRTDSVLTQDLHRFVSTQPSRAQQIDTLLQVLPFRGDKAFETFRTALRRSGQPWLAEQIAMELT